MEAETHLTETPEQTEEGIQIVIAQLKKYQLDPDEIISSWCRSAPQELWLEMMERNFEYLPALERKRPGICEMLVREFGIKNFGRYNPSQLIMQYDDRNRTDLPYGMVAFPDYDWSGQFYHRVNTYTELARSIFQHVTTRVIEVDGAADLARKILLSNARYNPTGDNLIRFGVVAAHADPVSMTLGDKHGSKRRELTVDQLRKHPDLVRRVCACFDPEAPVVFDGCRTGRLNSLAQEFSKYGLRSTGSYNAWTEVRSFNPKVEHNKKVTFNPKFRRSPVRTYYNGQLVA